MCYHAAPRVIYNALVGSMEREQVRSFGSSLDFPGVGNVLIAVRPMGMTESQLWLGL